MASLQNGAFLVAVIYLLTPALAMDNLQVAFEWKQLDFAYSYQGAREEAIKNGDFIPENNIPVGLEVFEDRLFVTIPRWKKGVPASLAYVSLTNKSTTSPELIPYPNWEAHRVSASPPDAVPENLNTTEVPPTGEAPASTASTPELVSPFRIRADRCGRLWVLDSGISDILGDNVTIIPPQIVIYDLRTDKLMKRYTIPEDQVKDKSMFANIAVEDTSCEDSFAYVADLKNPGLVVYSYKNDSSWRIQHNFFHPSPLDGDFNVTGINFQWDDGLFGIGLSGPGADGFSTLYFHPLASTNEFSVSTRILRNKTLADESFDDFKLLGNRGINAQSGVEFVDKTTGVLFYALVNLNAVACWKTSNKAYTIESQGRIFMSNTTMVFPNDVKVDDKGNLWVLSDRLSTFMYSKLDPEDVNFRILTESVTDAIRGTACDTNLSIDTLHKLNNIVNASDRVKERAQVLSSSTSPLFTINYIILAQVLAFFVAFQMH